MEELEQLRRKVEFLENEVRRKDRDWVQAWQALQQKFNERCVEVALLQAMLDKATKARKELTYD